MEIHRIHQPDINGTHAKLNQPLSAATIATFTRWNERGNLFAPNTSHTIQKVRRNIPEGLITGLPIVELGGAVYDKDGKKLKHYNALSTGELDQVIEGLKWLGLSYMQTVAFLPKFDEGDSHGEFVYIHPSESDDTTEELQARHARVDRLTRDPQELLRWLEKNKGTTCMIEFRPQSGEVTNLPTEFDGLHTSYDSGGTVFIIPHGVNKATTFLDVLGHYYQTEPGDHVSVAGDSLETDGPLFRIHDVTKIAVADSDLIQKGIRGEVHLVKSPEGARRVLEHKIKASTR